MNAGNLFRWAYHGRVFESRIESKCKACGREAVVRLPPELVAVQPDHTTHVCHPAIGGCNHGFSDVSDSIGTALAWAGYAATFDAFEVAIAAKRPADDLFDALDAFELANPEASDRRVEVLAEVIAEAACTGCALAREEGLEEYDCTKCGAKWGPNETPPKVEAYRDPKCQQCKGHGWLTGPADAPFERAIPCYACGGVGR